MAILAFPKIRRLVPTRAQLKARRPAPPTQAATINRIFNPFPRGPVPPSIAPRPRPALPGVVRPITEPAIARPVVEDIRGPIPEGELRTADFQAKPIPEKRATTCESCALKPAPAPAPAPSPAPLPGGADASVVSADVSAETRAAATAPETPTAPVTAGVAGAKGRATGLFLGLAAILLLAAIASNVRQRMQ